MQDIPFIRLMCFFWQNPQTHIDAYHMSGMYLSCNICGIQHVHFECPATAYPATILSWQFSLRHFPGLSVAFPYTHMCWQLRVLQKFETECKLHGSKIALSALRVHVCHASNRVHTLAGFPWETYLNEALQLALILHEQLNHESKDNTWPVQRLSAVPKSSGSQVDTSWQFQHMQKLKNISQNVHDMFIWVPCIKVYVSTAATLQTNCCSVRSLRFHGHSWILLK